MPIRYKIDVLKELKDHGYNTNVIRNKKYFSESTLQKFRDEDTNISIKNIEQLCYLLQLQPGDIFEYVEDNKQLT